jgi:Ca2+-binding RTX toxin-like protein
MDMLKGDMNSNVLMGMGGDDWDDQETTDVVEGGLFGGGGQDHLMGGDGDDWLDGGGRADEAGAITDDDGVSEANTANLLEGGAGNDMLIGGDGHDRDEIDEDGPDDEDVTTEEQADDDAVTFKGGLYGGAGNDTLDGGGGADKIMGEAGDDVIIYDAADNTEDANDGVTEARLIDMVDGGTGTDTLDGSESNAGLEIDLNATDDAFTNIENVIGSETAANTLTGDGMANTLTGGNLADTIAGNAGNDMIMAGEGNDIAIMGGEGNDTIYGGEGDDSLVGGAGADMLVGGEGNDSLTGNAGADTFVLGREPGHGGDDGDPETESDGITDTITDFNSLQGDVIDLQALNLSSDDLDDIIGAAEVADNAESVTLNLAEYDGGIVVIEVDGFGTLGMDDFII